MKDLAPGLDKEAAVHADWRHSLAFAVVCVLGVRVFLTVYLAAAFVLVPRPILNDLYAGTGVPLLTTGWEGALLGVWQREDALWFEKVATVGYSVNDLTQDRFPLYPMLMKLLIVTTGVHPIAAGILVSEISLVAALFLLHRMVLNRFGLGVASRTVAYIVLFPTAFFLHGPFTESTMLLLAVLAFYLLERNRWNATVPIAYFMGLARPQGALMGGALAIKWLIINAPPRQWIRLLTKRGSWAPMAGLLLAPIAGLITFLVLVDTSWRGPFAVGHRRLWEANSIMLPGGSIVHAVQTIMQGRIEAINLFDLWTALLFLTLAFAAFRRLDPSWGVYSILYLALPLSQNSDKFPLMSLSRYVLVLFPCFVVLAMWGERKWIHLGIITLWLTGLGFWSAIFYTGAFVG